MNHRYKICKPMHTYSFRRHVSLVVLIFHLQLMNMQQIYAVHSHLKATESPRTNELQDSYLQMFENYGTINNDDAGTVDDLPDSSNITKACPIGEFFYNTNPKHMKAVHDLQKIIMGQKSASDFIKLCANFRNYGKIHSKVWLSAVIGATESRPDTRHLKKPALIEVMPDRFVYYEVLQQLRQQAKNKFRQTQSCVRVDERFANDNGRESSLWYFREDLMVNSHHWYWHQAYPPFNYGDPTRADRRGELFYYMHQQVLARYDAERLSNGFPRVVALPTVNRTVLNEGYNAHLNDTDSRRPFTDRPPQVPLEDIYLGQGPEDPSSENSMTIEKLNLYRGRIENAITQGSINDTNGNRISLQNASGIDLLVDITEASQYSKNSPYYGRTGIHNMGHNIIAFVLDPKEPKDPPGVMADTGTSMRDIIFYRWHKFLDDLWDRHKQTLPPYAPNEGNYSLSYPVKITSVRIEPFNGRPGVISTFWSEKTFDLSRGLDLGSLNNTGRNPLRICAKHLNHEEFQYTINIEKRRGVLLGDEATVRIYMAPRFDEQGRRYSMDDQRRLFFALDIFQINLNTVNNTIVRRSVDSTLTVPYAQSYEEIQSGAANPYCGCGWPHHLLVPRGSETGELYDLFVMISKETDVGGATTNNTSSFRQNAQEGCQQAPILCGLFRDRYPFRYPMGYPFDRVPYSITVTVRPSIWWWEWKEIRRRVANLDEYIAEIPNMATIPVTVIHNNNASSITLNDFCLEGQRVSLKL